MKHTVCRLTALLLICLLLPGGGLSETIYITPMPSPAKASATASPDATLTTPTLRKGSEGDAVKALHEVLKALGLYDGALTDIFTEETRKAVLAAQKLFGIHEDGIAGPETLNMLDLERYSADTGKPGKTHAETQLLKKGMRGAQVRKLQERLQELGFSPGPIDGIFGSKTLAAVLKFQRRAGLVVDGIVGPKTWAKLNSGAASPSKPPALSRLLSKGDTGSDVKAVQARLRKLGFLDGKADGIFGKLTRKAVLAFQKDQGIKADGIVGPVTYGCLFP